MGTIRFVLAFSVVLGHGLGYIQILPIGGDAAVICFFMISGFYMALVLNSKYSTANSNRTFYKNRFLRIFPLYWFVAIVTLIVNHLFSYGNVDDFLTQDFSLSTKIKSLFANFFILGMDNLRPFWKANGLLESRLIPPAWSLEVEIIFYLVAPFIIRRLHALKLLILIVFGTAMIIINYKFANLPWCLIPRSFLFFTLGVAAYLLYTTQKFRMLYSRKLTVILFSLMVTYGYLFGLSSVSGPLTSRNLPLYVLFVVVLPFAFELTKDSKLDRNIGELSYPVYIVHWTLIKVCSSLHFFEYKWRGSLLSAVIIIITAIVVNQYVALPARKK